GRRGERLRRLRSPAARCANALAEPVARRLVVSPSWGFVGWLIANPGRRQGSQTHAVLPWVIVFGSFGAAKIGVGDAFHRRVGGRVPPLLFRKRIVLRV